VSPDGFFAGRFRPELVARLTAILRGGRLLPGCSSSSSMIGLLVRTTGPILRFRTMYHSRNFGPRGDSESESHRPKVRPRSPRCTRTETPRSPRPQKPAHRNVRSVYPHSPHPQAPWCIACRHSPPSPRSIEARPPWFLHDPAARPQGKQSAAPRFRSGQSQIEYRSRRPLNARVRVGINTGSFVRKGANA